MIKKEKSNINTDVLYHQFSNMSEREYNQLISNATTDDEKKFYLLIENYFMSIETEKAIASEKY